MSVNPPAAAPVSFEADIAPLFRPMDVQCMRGMGVFLLDYDYMKDPGNAFGVLDALQGGSGPRMPLGGPYWSDDSMNLFRRWMDGGYLP